MYIKIIADPTLPIPVVSEEGEIAVGVRAVVLLAETQVHNKGGGMKSRIIKG